MVISVRDGAAWKEPTPYVRDAGVWKPVDAGHVRDAGVWKEFYSSGFDPNTPIGAFVAGGYFGGKILIDSVEYALIVAPKSSGENGSVQWKTSTSSTPGTTSIVDGWANSNAMNDANHPAANWCRSLTIGGFSDWYLPAPYELDVVYFHLKPSTANNGTSVGINPDAIPPRASNYTTSHPSQTSVAEFQEGASEAFETGFQYYWSSQRDNFGQGRMTLFMSGERTLGSMTNNRRARAIRRIAI